MARNVKHALKQVVTMRAAYANDIEDFILGNVKGATVSSTFVRNFL